MILTLSIAAITLAATPQTATIINSGSTNHPGFRITLARSGEAEFTSVPRGREEHATTPIHHTIPAEQTKRLFADLEAAQPLSSLPAVHCMKSASFGSRLTISWEGEDSPDLNCGDGGDERIRNLIRDVKAITALFPAN